MARHAMVDLAQIFSLAPINQAADRLPPQKYEELYGMLCQTGVTVCRDGQSYERLREMRALYEGYAEALGAYLRMPLPPWFPTNPHKDNWLTVAKVRAKTEAANANGETSQIQNTAESGALLVDRHHDF
jgi:hypothetical protein